MNTTNTTPKYLIPLLLAVALAALLVGVWAASGFLDASRDSKPDDLVSATYLAGGKPVVEFALIDHHGERFDNARLQGQWTFLFFGFTYCPDICPMTLAVLDEVEEELRQNGTDINLKTVFVSVDPARDTPERLADYVPFSIPTFSA
nr:SCO family protein [Alkalilimnicola ehrlichii]